MKKALFFFCIVSLAAFYLHSCKPAENTPPTPAFYAAPQEVKDYCYFKKGSWWIYKDSVSGAYDTVTVTENKFDTLNNKNKDGEVFERYEFFETITYNSFDKYKDAIWLKDRPWLVSHVPVVFQTRYIPGDVKGTTIYQFYPYDINVKRQETNDYITLMQKSSSVVIDGKNYTEVLVYLHTRDPNMDYSPTEIWQAKNIGTIKKVIKDKNQNWQLVDYQIYQ